jgi:16S rRNA (uracil1498-N3)-methyltransferase
MTPPLFLIPALGDGIGVGDTLELTGAEAHHAAVVKRLAAGEIVLVADGNGGIARTEVRSADRSRVVLVVRERWTEPDRDPRLVVVQALPKGERAELAVETLTELGVDEIVPWSASRSVSIWRDDKAAKGAAKWRRTAVEASKQSRRARIPAVSELAATAAVTERVRAAAWAAVLHEDATEPLAAASPPAAGELLVIVGPEGGISDAELELFTGAGAQTYRLGAEVMRTSTAGAAALAVLSAATGRWR